MKPRNLEKIDQVFESVLQVPPEHRARFDYDVTADGRRFLVNRLVEQNAPSPVIVVMNWTAGLKR